MKVAIIDDERIYLDQIKILLKEYDYNFDIELFDKSEEFLKANIKQYAIVFLDIEMPGIDGIALANEIRNAGGENLIFYITSHTNYITSALRTSPFQYLVKPLDKEVFFTELERAISIITKRDAIFSVKALEGEVNIRIGDIKYIEILNRKIEIHTIDKIIYTYGTIKEIYSRLQNFNIIKIHASFLVALSAIQNIKGYEVVLKEGDTLPISKKNLKETRDRFAKYISRERV